MIAYEKIDRIPETPEEEAARKAKELDKKAREMFKGKRFGKGKNK